ncbi:hypothetical protein PSTEL_09665 [Paenibacillus stellifer]|uniref:Phage neck terminator protein gp12-like domain-containing protein n=1 Tax=Paenibacillus stellifer TaxID=169760 RepID=A0A089LVQ9_9BACL|nr:hypothetical protein [Paenibacillus stellifer]AIQ63313.1 hypothetical protein PSTEL_09665 [Paenibacillus stellifer]
MLPYEEIRVAIVEGLQEATGGLVIEMNGGGKMPTGSFITYTIFGFEPVDGMAAITQDQDKRIRRETVTFTVSFNCYADDIDAAIVLAMTARDWFKMSGREVLKDTLDVVVTDIGDIQNRDLNIGEEWERRQGFDVEFRATDRVESPLNWIDTAPITKE